MKSIKFLSSGLIFASPRLSHMGFLDVPAAIHGSKLIISDTTQDESSNELINPEILMNNYHKRIYSFTLLLPAIFPDTLYLLVPVVLLSEASSSSHIARQRKTLGSERSPEPR